MMTSSNRNFFRVTAHLCGEFTGPQWNSPHKGQWRGALMFSLICVWINGWVNNHEAGDLRRYRVRFDVIVMEGPAVFSIHEIWWHTEQGISNHSIDLVILKYSGPWFNIKMPSYQYRKSHCGDKTVVRSSYLHNGISYTGKTTSLYWIRALISTPARIMFRWGCTWCCNVSIK